MRKKRAKSISTYDFSTLYTKLPDDKVKSRLSSINFLQLEQNGTIKPYDNKFSLILNGMKIRWIQIKKHSEFDVQVSNNIILNNIQYIGSHQLTFAFSKSTIETLAQKLTIKTPERSHWHHFCAFNVNFEHISYLFLLFLMLTLNI